MWRLTCELVSLATFREEKWALSDAIHLYECRLLLLDVVIHAQVSIDSTDYIPMGCRELLMWLIEMGLWAPCQMSPIQILSVLGLRASAIPPPAGIAA